MSIYKKLILTVLIFLTVMLLLQVCGSSKKESEVSGKIYTYTGDSFTKIEDDYFTIIINEDGTFSYCESLASSYIGIGEWSVTDDILTLSDDDKMGYPLVNHFSIDGDDLVFIEKDSSNFIYIKVKDGERFTGVSISNDNR